MQIPSSSSCMSSEDLAQTCNPNEKVRFFQFLQLPASCQIPIQYRRNLLHMGPEVILNTPKGRMVMGTLKPEFGFLSNMKININ